MVLEKGELLFLFQDLVGVIYAVGGQTKSGNSLSTVEVFDPIVGRWRDAEAMSMLRSVVLHFHPDPDLRP